jgi:hypothetical protein
MYFKKFPKMLYDFRINGDTKGVVVKDISRNVRVRNEILANVTLYDEYDIIDGETPEIIAEKKYGSPLYHWVVMLCNEKFNYIDDFPQSAYELEQHITTKYGAGNEYNTHHYIDSNKNWVDSSNPEATSVSNYDYEYAENEKRRRIKLIDPTLLQIILKNYKDSF